MTPSWNKTLIFGRVAAEILTEKANQAATELLSELGKLDAERREAMREFIDEVNTRANTAQSSMSNMAQSSNSSGTNSPSESDLQATIDDLRAEIAATRNELQRYRNAQP